MFNSILNRFINRYFYNLQLYKLLIMGAETEQKEVTLTVYYVERVYTDDIPRKLLEVNKTDINYKFTGATKTLCREQARENFRSGLHWEEHWS